MRPIHRLVFLLGWVAVGVFVGRALPRIGVLLPWFGGVCALPPTRGDWAWLLLGLLLLYLLGSALHGFYLQAGRGVPPGDVGCWAGVGWAAFFWGMLAANAWGGWLRTGTLGGVLPWLGRAVEAAVLLPFVGLSMFLRGLELRDAFPVVAGLVMTYVGLAPLFVGKFLFWTLVPGTSLPGLRRKAAAGSAAGSGGGSAAASGQVQPAPLPAGDPAPKKRNLRAFDGLVGVDEAVSALKEAMELPVLYPDRVRKYRLEVDRGLLLVGPPGTGKTSLAKAAAEYFGCAFLNVNFAQLLGPYVGQSERNMHEVFEWARRHRPCILFFDELDAIGRERDGGHQNRAHDVLLHVMLQEMDGFVDRTGVFVLAATNRPDVLDRALVRPGRFDRVIELGLPDRQARLKLLEVFLRGRPGWEGFDRGYLERLADLTEGKSPAEIKALVNRAVRRAALADEPVEPKHFGL